MAEYIEREAVLAEAYYDGNFNLVIPAKKVRNIPAADVAPVRHARWDENGRCSNCGGHAPFWCMASTYYNSPWCQECGAKMDLEG